MSDSQKANAQANSADSDADADGGDESMRDRLGKVGFNNALEALKYYRPPETEAESERDGLLSTQAEVHGAALGLGMGAAAALAGNPAAILPFVLAVMGYTGGKNKARSGHMKEAMKEPAYSIISTLVAYLVVAEFFNESALDALADLMATPVVREFLGVAFVAVGA